MYFKQANSHSPTGFEEANFYNFYSCKEKDPTDILNKPESRFFSWVPTKNRAQFTPTAACNSSRGEIS